VLERVGKNYQECAQESGQHLDAGRYVRHGWYQLTTTMSKIIHLTKATL
jgi:hypothetical protein